MEDEQSGGLKQYKNWEELIGNEEIDMVSIATPPAFHVEISCAAMRTDKRIAFKQNPSSFLTKGSRPVRNPSSRPHPAGG